MDIETQRAEVSRTFLAGFDTAWKKASRTSISEMTRLREKYISHKVNYEYYMATRPDARFWISPLSRADENARQKRLEKIEAEKQKAVEKGIELPEQVASDIYEYVEQASEFDLGYD